MTTQLLFQLCLTVHIIGFILFAGTSFIDFLTFSRSWKLYEQDLPNVKLLLGAEAKYPARLIRIGMIAAVLGGVGMMAVTQGLFGEQIWMKIKFPLVVLVIINEIISRKRLLKLKADITASAGSSLAEFVKVKDNILLFQRIQIALCVTIIVLSAFKFH